jgi:hypothetical protein
VALEGGGEAGGEGGAFAIEGVDGVLPGEFEAELGAGDAGAGCLDDEGEAGGFDGALQAVPVGGWRAAEVGVGGAAQIEDDEAEVGVAGEEVGDLQGGEGGGAAGPDEVGEEVGVEGRGIEGVGPVDEGDAGAGGAGGGEELAEEEVAAAAGRGADNLSDGPEREAAGGGVDLREAGAQGRAGGGRGGGKAPGEEMPERREFFGRGHGAEDGRAAAGSGDQ